MRRPACQGHILGFDAFSRQNSGEKAALPLRKGTDHGMTEPLTVQQAAQRLLAADEILILCHKTRMEIPWAVPVRCTIACSSWANGRQCSAPDELPARYRYTAAKIFQGSSSRSWW